MDERSRANAQGGGMGETAAGAVLGGLLFGPFGTKWRRSIYYAHHLLSSGALFGASIGADVGAKNALDRAQQAEMEKMGINQDMLDAAEDIGASLERSNEGLLLVQERLASLQQQARTLDNDAQEKYKQAKQFLESNNEERARDLLLDRTKLQEKLKKVLLQCAEEKERVQQMERNVEALSERASEMDAMLRRAVGARTTQEVNDLDMRMSVDDPLLQKFKDAGLE